MPDLADRRELPVREDDLRAPGEAEAAGQRTHTGRKRGRNGDLVRRGVDEPGERRARRLLALDPVLPGCAFLVPIAKVLLVCRADRVGERTLGARVDVHALLEDGEP